MKYLSWHFGHLGHFGCVGLLQCVAITIGAFISPMLAQEVYYPETKRVDHVDTYHGEKVSDPYRWLEEDAHTSTAVANWVENQNKTTFGYLDSIASREQIRARLTNLWNYEKVSPPSREGHAYVSMRNDGLQNQSVVYISESPEERGRVLIDPNTWTTDGTIALTGLSFNPDGTLVAYGRAEAGSDWQVWRILNVATGEVLDEELRWIKFSTPEWTTDGKGFFYSRYSKQESADSTFRGVNKNQKLYYHHLGSDQSADVLVFHRPDQPDWSYHSSVSDDGHYLIIQVEKGTGSDARILIKDLTDPYGMPVDLIDKFESEFVFIGNDGTTFYFKTDAAALRGRLIAIDIHEPDRSNWREIVAEAKETLRGVNLLNNQFVATYLKDAHTAIRIYDLSGRYLREVPLPTLGSARGFDGKRWEIETFYSFSSFAVPPSIYRYDLVNNKSTRLFSAPVDMEPSDYETKQVFFTSKDGTRIPMFLCHRRGLKLNGNNPTLLYAYGGFNIPLTPSFSVTRLAWMEMGGVFAMANLRGGGEYGQDWHKAGTRLQKQNVFDDFIAAAQWLIANDYTCPKKLAIQGGSNGGLLVGACMVQRPELFGACLPAVGVMDMLRFHQFTIGWAWVDDYGSSDDPKEFQALRAYSPYHNLVSGTHYPATLVTTADTDDRVVPSHSFKFVAALQHAQSGDAPVLIRIETRAGHGAGKPTTKRIEEATDLWAFLVRNLDMHP
ncbi:MAG: prolyl oligopeptidase family serine peptidase [Pirellulales bacterium]